ncbi:DUF4112 domain-containing protein [Mesorhizobium sp. 113-3-9]|uniref:DUF4112 domain-containing protein n=1 Tax=Mesorhizobium sp. 113-3-9 TaxID=2744517 RepID=UPI00406C715E
MNRHGYGGAETDKVIAELDLLAALLDSGWLIPGTSILFGLDALVGLVPVLGDAATGVVSAYIVCVPETAVLETASSPACWETCCLIRS